MCGGAPEGEGVGGGGVLALGAGGAALERDGEQGEGTEAGFALAALAAALTAALEGGEGLGRAAASGRCDQARDSQSVEPGGGSAKSEGLHWPSASPRSRAPPSAPRFAADFAADFAAGEATREGEAALRLAGEREAGRAWAAAGEGGVGLRVEAGSPPPARAGVPTGLVYLGLGLGLGLG